MRINTNNSYTSPAANTIASDKSLADGVESTFATQRAAEIMNEIQAGIYEINPGQIAVKLHQFTMRLQ